MRRISGLALLAVCALALGSATGRGEDKKPGLEGTYIVVGIEIGGKDVSEFIKKEKEENRVFKITADKIIAMKDGKEDPASYKVDASKNPKEIDLVGKKGAKGKEQEEKMYGIYKVDGDKLIICMTESDKPADRPKDFKTTAESKAIMLTFQKKK